MKDTYLVYLVQAYDNYDKEKDLYMNVASIEVICKKESEAIPKAKKYLKRPKYRIIACYEKMMGE